MMLRSEGGKGEKGGRRFIVISAWIGKEEKGEKEPIIGSTHKRGPIALRGKKPSSKKKGGGARISHMQRKEKENGERAVLPDLDPRIR